ncbi:hypothetical protein C8F04DRAFT_154481 [Mycena alexandri]|uniref:Uncharacterized protein n=1 Tax=Mycena alexandri TaxID=1745969 RepID=A0AAD6S674_9AGAR|nr:hypothetical protein C8F04DRAFT_1139536 [Mycena alexandri]KAJ7024685.1 hypothetical protein C8F04DRAFT_154481 [Mycena alexandri]
MQYHPPFPSTQPIHPPPQWHPANPSLYAAPQKSHRTYPASSLKRTGANSTSSVWGGSTVQAIDSDSDSDDETIAAFTTTSIASSKSLAPGNKPHQQRRVAHWLQTTSQYKPDFKPSSSKSRHSSAGHKSEKHHRHEHQHGAPRRELPPVWVPHHTVPVQQHSPFLQPTVPNPPPQYAPQQPRAPVWVPGPPPPQMHGGMRTEGYVPYVPAPRTVVVHASHGHSSSKTEKGKGRKRSH